MVLAQNPWDYVNAIDEYNVPLEHRHQFYGAFVAMVSQRPRAEEDALINTGQRVFRTRAETMRKDIAELREQGASLTKIAPSVLCDDFMAEMIWVPDTSPSTRYLKYNIDGTSEIVDSVQVGPVLYNPPRSHLIDLGVVKLPTGIEEYDDVDWLFRELKSYVGSYLHLAGDTKFQNILVYYIFLTWIFDKFPVVPYLRAQGDFASGKSRLLQVVGGVSNRAVMAGGATTSSPIFRMMSRFKPTLIIDEADFNESDLWADIIKILNIGYSNDFFVLRSERGGDDNFDVSAFSCYGPKVLSTRKRFSDQALESRCLTYTMPSGGQIPAGIPFFLTPEFHERGQHLRNMLLLWRFRHYRSATVDPYMRLEGLDTRLNQILLPLFACAENDQMRKSILQHAREYQETLRADKRDSDEGTIALALIHRLRSKPKGTDRLLLKEIVDHLKQENPDMKVNSHTVGRSVRHDMTLSTTTKGGATWVTVRPADIDRLTRKYFLGAVLESARND